MSFRSRLAGYDKHGKIWINPNVPRSMRSRLRTHETVEYTLRQQGMTYRSAHRKALEAEHKGLTRKGIARYEGKLGAIARYKPHKR